LDKRIADRIKEIRDGEDREEFAKRIGVTKSTLGRYERGDTEPTSGTIARICATFGVMADWLVLGIGEKKRGVYPPSADPPDSSLLRELADERALNRELTSENRQLWKENGELKVKIGELNVQKVKIEGELDTAKALSKEYYERLQARAAPEDTTPHEAVRDVG